MKFFHLSGTSSSAKIASTGHAGTHAPQSMHSSGWMNSCSAAANSGSSFRGWMQSTGQTSTQAVSLVPTQGSQMMYATHTAPKHFLGGLSPPGSVGKYTLGVSTVSVSRFGSLPGAGGREPKAVGHNRASTDATVVVAHQPDLPGVHPPGHGERR